MNIKAPNVVNYFSTEMSHLFKFADMYDLKIDENIDTTDSFLWFQALMRVISNYLNDN